MQSLRRLALIALVGLLAARCTPSPPPATPTWSPQPPTPTATSTPEPPTPTPTPTDTPEPTPTATSAPTLTPEPTGDPRPEAEIMILEPGPGSRVVSPVHVAGVADPTFEQTLVIRVVLADGTEAALAPTTIDAPLGERGPFEIDVELESPVAGEAQAFIQVFHRSARDGGIVALESVGVTLTEEGPEEIATREPYLQQVAILSPGTADTVSGGVAQISAYGWASFEQTLVVEVQDETGDVIGSTPVTLSSDLGEPVPFTAEVPYDVESSGPGRIAIRDISAAFGGESFVTSVEVTLAP